LLALLTPVPNSPDGMRAVELFLSFARSGRTAHDWRKNDLRLMNTLVVPVLFGPNANIDWRQPANGLDQLEELCKATPNLSSLMSDARTPSAASRPPRPTSREVSARRLKASPNMSPVGYPASPRAQAQGRPPSPKMQDQVRAAGPVSARSVSPGAREPQPQLVTRGSSANSANSTCGPTSHRDAVRARREALERSRRKELQKAMEKKDVSSGGGADSEIEALEAQIASGTCSAAAAVGLKKRVAALKAQAIRNRRQSEQKQRMQQAADTAAAPKPEASAPVRPETPQQTSPRQTSPAQTPPSRFASEQRSMQDHTSTSRTRTYPSPRQAVSPRQDSVGQSHRPQDLPEPAIPPPRKTTPSGPDVLPAPWGGVANALVTSCR